MVFGLCHAGAQIRSLLGLGNSHIRLLPQSALSDVGARGQCAGRFTQKMPENPVSARLLLAALPTEHRGDTQLSRTEPPPQLALPPLTAAAMLLGQQVVCQRRRVSQTLHSGVQEAGVAQVVESCSDPVHPLPFHGQALHGEENFLGSGDAVPRASQSMVTPCKRERSH